MSPAKKTVCVFLCVILTAVLFSSTASAITLDGIIGNTEWGDAQKPELFPNGTNTNSDINFAFMRVFIDRNNSAVFLAFQVIQKTANALQPGNTAVGVKLNIKSGSNITCRISGADEFDHSTYSVEKIIVIGTNNDYMIEMRIGYLFGLPQNPLLGLQLIDGYGNFSNYYSFPAVETTTSTTAVSTTKATTSNPSTTKASTTKPTTATTKPTTAATTTKATTTKSSTTKASTTNANTTNVTPGSTVTGTTRSQTNGANSPSGTYPASAAGTLTGDSVTNEAGEIAPNGSTDTQNSSGEPDDASDDQPFAENDSNEKGSGIGIKKQIAAITAAAILIALAVYLCIIAASRKTEPKTKPEKPETKADEDVDDDF